VYRLGDANGGLLSSFYICLTDWGSSTTLVSVEADSDESTLLAGPGTMESVAEYVFIDRSFAPTSVSSTASQTGSISALIVTSAIAASTAISSTAAPTTTSAAVPAGPPPLGGGISSSVRIGLGVGSGLGISLLLAAMYIMFLRARKRRWNGRANTQHILKAELETTQARMAQRAEADGEPLYIITPTRSRSEIPARAELVELG
jgi:hypothetical protein